jgi:hypothetical protein
VTETDELAAALDSAAARYPGLSRGQLLTLLALESQRVAQRAQEDRRRQRLDALVTRSPASTVRTIWKGCARSGRRDRAGRQRADRLPRGRRRPASRAESLLAREIDDEFAANPLTPAEVLAGPSPTGRLDAACSALRELEVAEQPFPADTSVRQGRLRADTRLRMPDCCVLLAAQDAAVRVAAFGDRLIRAAEELGLVALRS